MARHNRDFDRSANDDAPAQPGPPVIDATEPPIETGTTPLDLEQLPFAVDGGSRLVDYAAMDRKDTTYVNPEYVRPETLDPYGFRDLSVLETLYGAPRRAPADSALEAFAHALRRFARMALWSLPAGALCVALGAAGGWPTSAAPTTGNPRTWFVLTLVGLILTVLGVVALAALLGPTPGAWWAAAGLVAMVAGSLLLAPVLALVGLVRPVGPDLGEGIVPVLEAQVLDSATARWLGVLGLVLIAVAGLALGCGVLATRILNRTDGWLILVAVTLAVTGAYVGWQFLLVLAGMALLAASLGLAWTASRLTPDGALREF